MPISGARYRYTTTKTGKKIRLAFKDNVVVEAKNPESGITHTSSEFAADRKKKRIQSSDGYMKRK